MPTELESQLISLRARKAQLQELARLEKEVWEMESFLLQQPGHTARTVRIIAEVVCAHYHVPVASIIRKSKELPYLMPRHLTFYLSVQIASLSFEVIAKVLHRHRTAILHSYNKISTERKLYPGFDLLIQSLASEAQTALSLQPTERKAIA